MISLVTDAKKIAERLFLDERTAANLLEIDRGPKGGNMTTFGLEGVVTDREVYCLTLSGLKSSQERINVIDLEEKASRPWTILKPACLEINAIWEDQAFVSGEGNNILGDNGRLLLPFNEIDIPIVEAQDEFLAYYGATLIHPGDVVRFPNEEFPIWKMEVGPRYVDDFLMTEQGGGYYLEYHKDRPHFHHIRKGGGYYLLAKWNEEKTKLQMTGFRIPEGFAVYTKMGAIHCDAALIGEDLSVGYATSDDCSTVLLRDPNDQYVKIHFTAPSKPRLF